MALLSTTMLLQYERAGHCCTRKILSPGDVRAVVPSIDAAFAAQELDSCRQKIRVIAGEEALEKADAAAGADPAERLRSLRRAVQALPSGSVPFLQCFNLWRSAPAVFELLCSAEIAGTAAQLLGADRVRLYQDSLFLKRPGDGETHWHSDLAMAPLDTNDFVTVWLPLQPVPAPEQGGSGLLFASRSHRDVALPMWHGEPHTPLDASDRGYAIESAGRLAVGDASWHHGWMLHSAAANEMKAPRRALAASFFADGARRLRKPRRAVHDEDAESSAAWLSDVRPGRPASHALLPLVWPPEPSRDRPREGGRDRAAVATGSQRRRGGGGAQLRRHHAASGREERGGASGRRRGRGAAAGTGRGKPQSHRRAA